MKRSDLKLRKLITSFKLLINKGEAVISNMAYASVIIDTISTLLKDWKSILDKMNNNDIYNLDRYAPHIYHWEARGVP